MNDKTQPNRCRIVLLAGPSVEAGQLQGALDGGDVASVILFQEGLDEASFQSLAESLVPLAQQAGYPAPMTPHAIRFPASPVVSVVWSGPGVPLTCV